MLLLSFNHKTRTNFLGPILICLCILKKQQNKMKNLPVDNKYFIAKQKCD